MIRLIRFFFIIKSYAAVFPGRNTPIIPGTGYASPVSAHPESPVTGRTGQPPHPLVGTGKSTGSRFRKHGHSSCNTVPGCVSIATSVRGGTGVRGSRNFGTACGQDANGVPSRLAGLPATRLWQRHLPERHFATASFARICASMSSVMRERSHSGFQPHSSRAPGVVKRIGQLSAISFFTGSTS